MLSVLRIENLAIIEKLEVEFDKGFNILTGETGAGKSIILKSIDLLSGKRSSAEIIRSGAEKCIIEGLFILTDEQKQTLFDISDEAREVISDDELLIRRVIDPSGRSKFYLNGALTTAGALQHIALPLIEITSQHEQHALLEPAEHRKLLDSFGVPKPLLERVSLAYSEYAKAMKEMEEHKKNSRERHFYYERIRTELEELQTAAIIPGERLELETELGRMQHLEQLGGNVDASIALLGGSESQGDERSIEDSLRELLITMEQSAKIDPSLQEILELIRSAEIQLSEARISLADYLASLEADPDRLEFLRARIAELARLERKYQKKDQELVDYSAQIEQEVRAFEAGGLDEKVLAERVDALRSKLTTIEDELTKARISAAKKLQGLVENELKELEMKRARFMIEVSADSSGPYGKDKISFLLAANPGEPFRPLDKVASGGELSRIFLVLRTLFSESNPPALQVFDEIDSGVGGHVAQVVGERLQALSKKGQVLIITHAPQVAALADAHFVVSKTASQGKTRSQINRISGDDRVQAVARMLAGKDVSQNFQESAKELLSLGAKISAPEKSATKKRRAATSITPS